jgi:2-oxoisovalerate dehydrogenase E1 component
LRRITRPDTWVPYNFENQIEVLPSFKKVLEAAVGLLDGEIAWRAEAGSEAGIFVVEAVGSSPADESISVIAWKVKPGDAVEAGMLLAEMEADKAALELNSPVSGTVEALLVEEGFSVKVGTPIMHIRTAEAGEEKVRKTVMKEEAGIPVITGLKLRRDETEAEMPETGAAVGISAARAAGPVEVGIVGIAGATGSRRVGNEEISRMCPTWTPADIVKRTGISSRPWLGEGETVLTLAVDACGKLFARTRVRLQDIDLILCSTGTPIYNTPALATMIHHELAAGDENSMIQAYDISAACSGYLYGLQIAYDFLQSRPDAKILLVTAEALSPKTDTADPDTAPIFGDAATATLLAAGKNLAGAAGRVLRPVLSAKGESGEILRVPAGNEDKIFMEGPRVFQEAVRGMMSMLEAACREAGIRPEDLDLVVPHQANQRIINAVRQKLKAPVEKVFSNIKDLGNTSSSTIPLCLETLLREKREGRRRIGMTAFGGGFTFGGGVIDQL